MKNTRNVFLSLLFVAGAFAACDDDDGPGNGAPMADASMLPGTGGTAGLDAGAIDSQSGAGGTTQLPDAMPAPQPRGAANRPAPGPQIDRAGRPAISTALIATFNGDSVVKSARKDAYNGAAPAQWQAFAPDIKASLGVLDALDGNCGNQLLAAASGDRYAMLAGVLADDQLYIFSDRGTCGTYLGAEAEVVGALAAGMGGCGGRTLTDDVIERSYSVLAAGVLTGVDDTITADTAPHDNATFPFVAPPQPQR